LWLAIQPLLRIKELYFGKLYHWRVRAIKGNDTSSWSAVWFFYTYNPARLNSPANNQVGTTLYSLDWNSINGTTGYHYILASDTNLVNRWEGKEGKDNAFFHYFDKDPTDFNTKYFWKVRVFHAKDTSGWSDIWKFTTRKRNGVKLTYPKVNETAIPLGLIMAWDAFSSATNYTVEYSENSDMSSAVISSCFKSGFTRFIKAKHNLLLESSGQKQRWYCCFGYKRNSTIYNGCNFRSTGFGKPCRQIRQNTYRY
jgi:hypothetical protein